MKTGAMIFVLGILGALAFAMQRGQPAGRPTPATAAAQHASSEFELTVHAPYQQVFPLFGAHGERLWGGKDWDPKFIYPQPEEDREGAVFTVAQGHEAVPWVMTAYDQEKGHVQYVFFRGGVLITKLDIRLAPVDGTKTRVRVAYDWTALNAEVSEHLQKMVEAHAGMGPHWEAAINGALQKSAEKK